MKKFIFVLSLVIAGAAMPVFAITPMEYYNSLVAGSDNPGFRDGAFYQALFDHPCGIAIDDSGNRLFVADSNNHRIRVIYLNDDNRVETLAGTDKAGKTDGPLSSALFDQPAALAYMPGDRLAVYDRGNHHLRLIDIPQKTVTTLAGGSESILGNVWSLGYLPQDDSIYLSEPYDKRLRKWDMRSQKLMTVLSENPQLPMPRAICVNGNKLYVADINLPEIYRLEPSSNTFAATAALIKVGNCAPKTTVNALAGSGDVLYAAQEETNTLIRILPDNHPVTLETAWGFYVENNDQGVEPLLQFTRDGMPSGFVLSPKDNHKLYVTCPDTFQSIISVKDYDFGQSKDDFSYPDKKPEGTFRILIAGDSRVNSAMLPLPPDKLGDKTFDVIDYDQKCSAIRTHTFSKQLEFFLNANAVLKGVKTHFEVFRYSLGGTGTGSIMNGPVMDIVKKKDIDLVVALVGWTTYKDYFGQPLTPEGLPGGFDPEWVLKPANLRVPPGVPRHLFDLCTQKKLVSTDKDKFFWNIDLDKWNSLDLDVRKDLMDLDARPFEVFQTKLQSIKTAGSEPKRLLMLFIPWKYMPSESYEDFWKDVCSAGHLDLLDLTQPFYALKTSFYPTAQRALTNHYLYYGDNLIAFLLDHYLTEQKWIPFEIEKQK